MRILLLLLLTGCYKQEAIVSPVVIQPEKPCFLKQEIGNITYYSYSCNHCRYTGNGEVFDTSQYTIAYYDPHEKKRAYYNKYAIVTNLTTGVSCVVKITDSGMFREGIYKRKNIIFDATPRVFHHLGFTKHQGIGNNVMITIFNTEEEALEQWEN